MFVMYIAKQIGFKMIENLLLLHFNLRDAPGMDRV